MDEVKEKKPPLDREEFKLLTENERKFVDNPTDLLKEYKSPDAMVRQYNNRIKYRAINAIRELAWLCDKLPEDQLKKIFTDEVAGEFFKISEKSLASWTIQDNKEKLFRDHVKNIMPHFFDLSEVTAFEELIDEYETFYNIQKEMSELKGELVSCMRKNIIHMGFIRKKGLEEELESYRNESEKSRISNLKKAIASGKFREDLKKIGWSDENIDELIKEISPE